MCPSRPSVSWNPFFAVKSQHAQAILAARFHPRFQFAFAEDDSLAYGNFSPGANQRLPCIGLQLTHQKNFDRRLQMLVARGTLLAGRLGVDSSATAEQTRRQDARVVDHD